MASESQTQFRPGPDDNPEAETIVRPQGEADAYHRVRGNLLAGRREPERIGRYRILRRLGIGGMSLVYAAHDEELDREVAIKLLQRSFASARGWRSRLRREAVSMAKLSHVNIAHVYEVGDHEDQPYIAMELVRGPTLGQWLKERERSVPEVIAMYGQAARGLAAAHEAGLVHRDFKPDNVIVDEHGWARVLDFGLVLAPGERPADPNRERSGPHVRQDLVGDDKTRPGTVLGTPVYMAPEQMRGEEVDGRADQFAFCVALFESLHGHRPFEGRTMHELATAIERGATTTDSSARVPPAINRVIEHGLQADPGARYPNMGALIDALSLAMQQRERSALEQEAVDGDFRRNRDVRIKLLVLDGVVLGGAAAVLSVARVAGWHRAGYLDAVVVLAVFWIANLVYRRRLVAEVNAVNRRWHAMTMILAPLWLIHFGLCAWGEVAFTTALALATVLCAGVVSGANMMVNNANPVLPVGLLLTGAAILAWPPLRGLSLCLGVVGTFVASRWVLKRRAALQARDG